MSGYYCIIYDNFDWLSIDDYSYTFYEDEKFKLIDADYLPFEEELSMIKNVEVNCV